MNSLFINLKKIYIQKTNVKNNILWKKIEIIFIKIIACFLSFIIIISLFLYKKKHIFSIKNYNKNNKGYKKSKFAILRRLNCPLCGLFSDFNTHLGCINKYLALGYIPIIDLSSFENMFNGFKINLSFGNPWELFFDQPFNYTLNEVKQKAKKIKIFECSPGFQPSYSIYLNSKIRDFWHNLEKTYMPIKKEILIESNYIFKNLFKGSLKILGILMRGTDYTSLKPATHPIPPGSEIVIRDIETLIKNKTYEWLFITTEDDKIREVFINKFGQKIKYLKYNKKINYNITEKQYLSYNKNIKGNIKYIKIYLLNIIILSKCIDIICAQTSGSIGAFVLKNGYRFSKVYYLGYYS
jgi:hypothetical protein